MGFKYIYTALALIGLLSCKSSNETVPATDENGYVIISEDQFNSEGMQLGTAELSKIEEVLACNGIITAMPNGMAEVSLVFPGVIKKVFVRQGQMVHAGQALIEIGGNELIDLQNDFASAAINHRRLESEFKRADLLFKQNVGSEKEFRVVESEYQNALALYNGLKLKIQSIGLNINEVETGKIVSAYNVTAPIKGVISDLEANIGLYPAQGAKLLEILDKDAMQIKLSVFPEDLNGIEVGTPVNIVTPDKKNIMASISSVGSVIDPETRAVECYAVISDNKIGLVNNAFVSGEIVKKSDSTLMVPTGALQKSGENYALLSLAKKAESRYYFTAKTVTVGRQSKGMTEIADTTGLGKVLLKGVYNIVSE